jgi:ankyrin repeat protein
LLAARKGHTEIVGVLLDKGASVDATDICGYTALINSAKNGHTEIVCLLLDRDVNVTECRIGCMYAVAEGHIELFEKLYRSIRK